MYDSLRENLSYFGLYKRMFKVKKIIDSEKISYGSDKEQYFLYYVFYRAVFHIAAGNPSSQGV